MTGWSKMRLDEALPDPVCFGSLVRMTGGPRARRTASCSSTRTTQRAGAAEPDGEAERGRGRTWPVSRAIEPGTSGYADLAVGPDGMISCLYERARRRWLDQPSFLCLARFNLEWLAGEKTR